MRITEVSMRSWYRRRNEHTFAPWSEENRSLILSKVIGKRVVAGVLKGSIRGDDKYYDHLGDKDERDLTL